MELFVPATIYICNESHQSLPSIAPVKDSLVRQYLCAIGGSNKYIEPGVAIGKLWVEPRHIKVNCATFTGIVQNCQVLYIRRCNS